jgi:hypothetical protein
MMCDGMNVVRMIHRLSSLRADADATIGIFGETSTSTKVQRQNRSAPHARFAAGVLLHEHDDVIGQFTPFTSKLSWSPHDAS